MSSIDPKMPSPLLRYQAQNPLKEQDLGQISTWRFGKVLAVVERKLENVNIFRALLIKITNFAQTMLKPNARLNSSVESEIVEDQVLRLLASKCSSPSFDRNSKQIPASTIPLVSENEKGVLFKRAKRDPELPITTRDNLSIITKEVLSQPLTGQKLAPPRASQEYKANKIKILGGVAAVVGLACFIFSTFAPWPGSTYVGEYTDNKMNGQGTYTSPDGTTCVGKFKDSTRNGQGTCILPDGTSHVGEFKDGKMNGQGTYTSPDGTTHVGEFKDGKMNGQGTYTSPDGTTYVGEFKDGKMNGQGTYILPDGATCVGEFKDDTMNGQVTCILPDGINYVGWFKDGTMSGEGTYILPDGTTYSA